MLGVRASAIVRDIKRGQGMGVEIWRTKENAERYAKGQGRQVLEAMRPLLQKMSAIRSPVLAASTHGISIGHAASSS